MSKRLARRKMPKHELRRVKAFAPKQAVEKIRARWGEKAIRLASTDNKQTD